MNIPLESLVLTATILYFIGLSFSIYEKTLQRSLSKFVLLGVFTGFALTANVVAILIEITRYDKLPILVVVGIYAPIVEEILKFLSIVCLGFLLQGMINKFEMIRLSGAIGLGFSSMETLQYIAGGIDYQVAISRLLVTTPLHIGSALLIGIGLTERKLLFLLPTAIAFHSLSNLLALSDCFIQGLLCWIILLFLYCFSEIKIR